MEHRHSPRLEGGSDVGELEVIDSAPVEELLRALSTALRSYRLYGGQDQRLERFVQTFRAKLGGMWEEASELCLEIGEKTIRWKGQVVYPTGGDTGEIAFLFYKDGVRSLTFLPGFEEGGELERLLSVLARAPQLRQEEEDDLLTLLWQEDFSNLKYEYVELTTDTSDLSIGALDAPAGTASQPVDASSVHQDAAAPSPGLSPDDFQETLHFLDEAELRQLALEVRLEMSRDLWRDVTAALYDRLEDGPADRQSRIIRICNRLLANSLGAGQFGRAAGLLRELTELANRPGLFKMESLRELRTLFGQLAQGETIHQLAMTLEENPEARRNADLGELLGYFPPMALAPLMRATEAVSRPDVRRTLEDALHRLARENRKEVVRLLSDPDPSIKVGALRWVGRLRIREVSGEVLRLLARPEPEVCLACIEALQELRDEAAGPTLEGLLQDGDRDIRIAAAKALGALGYTPALPTLKEVVTSKRIRSADRTEKMAIFETFGRLAGRDGVELLDGILNGRSWLGRTEAAEVRACAAIALGHIRDSAAREVLDKAAGDEDPVVRSAVARALRKEEHE